MKKSLTRAWRLVKKYREVTRIPPPGDRPRPRSRVKSKRNPPQRVPIEKKYPVDEYLKLKASTKKVYNKRKMR